MDVSGEMLNLKPFRKIGQSFIKMFALCTGCIFFPTLGTGLMFSCAWNRLHVFPRLVTGCMFSTLGTIIICISLVRRRSLPAHSI